ncbi:MULTISPECIES: OsmC family protein [Bacillus cereus group]|uniref:Uncharacterized protein n=1 Tax=Bacillus cereus TaxID=1396 RepID=A0A9W7QF96_BACCE|nr:MULTISPECIES: OsmC family protein [Bacillus cereus group]KAB2395352.1 hypothetical protein F8172_14860 [Bacillus cereus]KAB2408106.1 hypothetical protein F8170_09860 [Bacillus cereus]KAB2430935.1 hypothetical protein F8168_06440 [Bacillus cereus]MCU4786289.1 OsmC family protein [Bacillus cereus]MCU5556781.1 OsmC family protein [Bacillus cereus]
MEHIFEYKGNWKGGLSGEGAFKSGNLEMEISVPADMNGKGIGTNPEELLISAASSCYLITLASILQFKKIEVENIELVSKAVFKMNMNGPTLTKITHTPQVIVDTDKYDRYNNEIMQCIQMAEKGCMVSRAIQSNVIVEASGTVMPLVK